MHLGAVLEAAESWGDLEGNAAAAPISELGEQIFGDEGDVRVVADQLELFGGGRGGDQGEIGGAVWGSNGDEGAAGFDAGIEDELEAEKVDVEIDAAIEIADKYGDRLQTEVRFLAVEADRGVGEQVAGKIAHGEAL